MSSFFFLASQFTTTKQYILWLWKLIVIYTTSARIWSLWMSRGKKQNKTKQCQVKQHFFWSSKFEMKTTVLYFVSYCFCFSPKYSTSILPGRGTVGKNWVSLKALLPSWHHCHVVQWWCSHGNNLDIICLWTLLKLRVTQDRFFPGRKHISDTCCKKS